MKHLNLKLIFFIIAVIIANVNCSGGHCDDEDLTRDKDTKEATVLKHQDSLNLKID